MEQIDSQYENKWLPVNKKIISHLKGNKFSKVVISQQQSGKISYIHYQNYKILELHLFNCFNSFDRSSRKVTNIYVILSTIYIIKY